MASNLSSDSSNHPKTPDRSIPASSETKKSPQRKRSSWMQLPHIMFPSEQAISKSPVKADASIPQTDNESTVPKPKPKFLMNVSKGVHDIASSLRKSTHEVAEDIFGAHKEAAKTTGKEQATTTSAVRPGAGHPPPSDNQSKDIFSASLSDVLVDIGKDAIKLIKPIREKKPPSSPIKSTSTPNVSPARPKSSQQQQQQPTAHPRSNRRVSELLEIDSSDIDSSKLSTFHIDQSQLINEEPFPRPDNAYKFKAKADQGNPTTNKLNVKQARPPKPSSFASKTEFLQSLTDMPEELLPDQNEQPNESSSQLEHLKAKDDSNLDDDCV
jgi:hypothetical protein